MSLILLIALILFLLWALGLFAFHLGSLMWIVLILAVCLLAYELWSRRR